MSGLCPCPAVVKPLLTIYEGNIKGVRVYIQNERNERNIDKKKGLGVKVRNVRFILQKERGLSIFNPKKTRKFLQKRKRKKITLYRKGFTYSQELTIF